MREYDDRYAAASLSPVLQILRDMKKDVRDTKATVDIINRELGGVQATLRTMEHTASEQQKRMDLIRSEQLSCPARTGYSSVRSNIKKLEGEIDATKETTGIYPLMRTVPELNLPFKDLMAKALPYLVIAFVSGAGILSVLLFKVFFNK